jgi:hypothetical protein
MNTAIEFGDTLWRQFQTGFIADVEVPTAYSYKIRESRYFLSELFNAKQVSKLIVHIMDDVSHLFKIPYASLRKSELTIQSLLITIMTMVID